MTPLERALDLSYPAFAILHQHGRFSGPQHQRVCEAILGDLRIARRQAVRGVVLGIFLRDQQVMGLLLPDAGPPELLGFDDHHDVRGGCQGLGGQGALAWRPIAPLKLATEQAQAFLWLTKCVPTGCSLANRPEPHGLASVRQYGRPTSRDETLQRSAPQVPTAPHCMRWQTTPASHRLRQIVALQHNLAQKRRQCEMRSVKATVYS